MTEPRPAPYPADTRAKGWRFELDLERIEQSDTWALATPDVRPWLFLLWAKSWQQVPCGSLPDDDALIAARIGMPIKAFMKARAVLLRGWWLAEDGRLYHDVIAARVQSMLDAKRKESERKAAYRAKMDAERGTPASSVPPVSHGTTAGLHPPSTGCDATGTSTSTGTGTRRREEEKETGTAKPPRPSRKCPASFEPIDPDAFVAQHAPGVDWRAETAKFRDHTYARAITDWHGAWRNWIRRAAEMRPKVTAPPQSFRERDAEIAAARVREMTGGLVDAKPPGQRADATLEVFDATPRLVG